ncbi:unnamed protein product [Cunninghamella blakesleeana]
MRKTNSLHLESQPSTKTTTTFGTENVTPNPPASPPNTPLACSPVPLSPSSTPSPSSSYSSILRPSSSLSTSAFRENIQVMIRCRPPATSKNNKLSETVNWKVSLENGTIEINDNNATTFEYDKVIEGTDNNEVYESGINDLVRSTMEGYNGTVFAYGITNSGKTYTMTGTDEEPGVIPNAIHDVFAWIEDEALDREFLLQVSYLEIYNEKIKDLLNPNQKSNSLEIRTTKTDVVVEGLYALPVTTEKEVLDYINKGQERRHISSTDFNAQSSRSHTIFQLIIESKSKSSSLDPVRLSKLNLIDLAGSEKVATDLDRRHEGSHINKSLLTLGKVITSLINGTSHVPYRDSKLTRILQTSLSGNARVAVVCTINPDVGSKEESMNTLRFAQNVKKIETRAVITKITQPYSRLQNYKEQIAQLQTQMQEKTEKEAETKQRLSHLLSLILTSKKASLNSEENKQIDLSADDENILLSGSVEDVVYQCEQQLTAAIGKHQHELEEKNRDLELLETQMIKTQQSLSEKTNKIETLENELVTSQRTNEEKNRELEDRLKEIQNDLTEKTNMIQSLENTLQDTQRQEEEKSHDIEQLNEHLLNIQNNLNEKTEMILELENALTDTQRINEDQSTQLNKYSKDIAALNKRWTEIEKMVADYKEKYVASEAKVVLLEARHEADQHIKNQLNEQLEDFKFKFDKRLEEERLMAMVQSIQEEKDEDEDEEKERNEQKKDNNNNEDKKIIEELNNNIIHLEQQLKEAKNELEKEHDRNSIYSKKLDEVQVKLLAVENALKKSIADAEKEKQQQKLQQQKLQQQQLQQQMDRDSLKDQIATNLSLNIIQNHQRKSDNVLESIWRCLYLQNGAWVVLIAFAIYLFI